MARSAERIEWEREFNDRVSARIRRARQAAGIPQYELANLVGLHRTTIANIEAGRGSASAGLLWLISNALDQPLDTFVPSRSGRLRRTEAVSQT